MKDENSPVFFLPVSVKVYEEAATLMESKREENKVVNKSEYS